MDAELHFSIFPVLHFYNFKFKITNRCDKSYGLSDDVLRVLSPPRVAQIGSYLTQKLIRETTKVGEKKMQQLRTLTQSKLNGTLKILFVL